MDFDSLFAPFLWICGLRSIHDIVSPFCCDGWQYLENGLECAKNTANCWHPYRPVGANMYFSIQFRMPWLTLHDRWIYVLLNMVWVAASIVMAYVAMVALLGIVKWWKKLMILVISAVAHYVYFAPTITVPLSDVPAGCATLLGLWLLIAGGYRPSLWKLALAGLALGIGISIRSFYLYPTLIAVLLYVGVSLLQRRRSAIGSAILFFVLCLMFPAMQYSWTYQRTHAWSYLHPDAQAQFTQTHFGSNAYGYDTLMRAGTENEDRAYYYKSERWSDDGKGILGRVRSGDLGGGIALAAMRDYFYLGSYAKKTYLFDPIERTFSPWILAISLLASLLSCVTLQNHWRRPGVIASASLLASVLAEATIMVPEQRFVVVWQVGVAVLGFGGGLFYVADGIARAIKGAGTVKARSVRLLRDKLRSFALSSELRSAQQERVF